MIEKIKNITRGQAILLGIIVLAVAGTFIGFKIANTMAVESYKKFEEELEIVAQNYKDIKNIKVKKDGEKRVSLSALKKQNLVTNPLKDKCAVYVMISNEETYPDEYEYIYRSYIKCGSRYKTEAYLEY